MDEVAVVDRLETEIKTCYLHRTSGMSGAPIAKADLRSVLTDYLYWRARLVDQRPRAVHRSAHLLASPQAVAHRDELDMLLEKIVSGEDLTPHLSKSVGKIDRRDRMLWNWGIHHLHLDPAGTADLLFVVFRPDDAFLIGVYPHQSWALQEVAEIIVRTWPEQQIFLASRYVIDLAREWSDTDRLELLLAGVNAGLKVDGCVYLPRTIGQTVDGGSAEVARSVVGFIDLLNQLRWNFDERIDAISRDAERSIGRNPEGDWEPAIHDGHFGLFHQDGNVFARVGEML